MAKQPSTDLRRAGSPIGQSVDALVHPLAAPWKQRPDRVAGRLIFGPPRIVVGLSVLQGVSGCDGHGAAVADRGSRAGLGGV